MPNTLAHLGVQLLASKALFKDSDTKWIALGCIIPDLPWILQRLAQGLFPGEEALSLRLYCIVQASLLCSLLLSAALSLLTPKANKLFLLLGFNCLLHLLLDSLQIKWANGVHLLAPLSWQLTSFNLFWPEHWLTTLFSLTGVIAVSYFGWSDRNRPAGLQLSPRRCLGSVLLLAAYLILPLVFRAGPLAANNHFLATIAHRELRTGQDIQVDRGRYHPQEGSLQLFTGERLQLSPPPLGAGECLSLQGTFLDGRTVKVQALHHHSSRRDTLSRVGLFLVLFLWLLAIFAKAGRIRPH
ncbi:hypothetical protein [Desulfogranum mediterraneum]|uniref:hypothetical protein n=1 Tax=Desulfogranum mediterraneum TaxID=160661 RepID=UPI00041E2B45|nr:hypothetical protein [Desulfogranum mediterraneum]